MNKKSKLNKNKNNNKKYINIFIIILLIIAIPIINYFIINTLLKISLFIIIIFNLGFIFIKTNYYKQMISFIQETKTELKNITWSKRKEIIQSTLAVLAIILCTSIVLWIIDSILTYIISKII